MSKEAQRKTDDDPTEEEYRRWERSPEGIVVGYLRQMDRDELRLVRKVVDDELDTRDDRDRREAALELNRLTRTLAEHKGCPVEAVHWSEHTLSEARAAVERGEISDISEYIPF